MPTPEHNPEENNQSVSAALNRPNTEASAKQKAARARFAAMLKKKKGSSKKK